MNIFFWRATSTSRRLAIQSGKSGNCVWCFSEFFSFGRYEPSVYLSSSGEERGGRDRNASTFGSAVYGDDEYTRFDGVDDYLGSITASCGRDVSFYIRPSVRSFVRSFGDVYTQKHGAGNMSYRMKMDNGVGTFNVRSRTTRTTNAKLSGRTTRTSVGVL